jgi:hypothetical protein
LNAMVISGGEKMTEGGAAGGIEEGKEVHEWCDEKRGFYDECMDPGGVGIPRRQMCETVTTMTKCEQHEVREMFAWFIFRHHSMKDKFKKAEHDCKSELHFYSSTSYSLSSFLLCSFLVRF